MPPDWKLAQVFCVHNNDINKPSTMRQWWCTWLENICVVSAFFQISICFPCQHALISGIARNSFWVGKNFYCTILQCCILTAWRHGLKLVHKITFSDWFWEGIYTDIPPVATALALFDLFLCRWKYCTQKQLLTSQSASAAAMRRWQCFFSTCTNTLKHRHERMHNWGRPFTRTGINAFHRKTAQR